MICAIYGRVSTDKKFKGDLAGQDPDNQLHQLREFAAKSDWEILELVDYVSAKNREDRANFELLFSLARQRKIDMVLFWSLDRFSREGSLPTLRYLEELTKAGCGWKSYTEQYLDSTGMFRDAIIAILAALAKQERTRTSERTKAGLDRARREGKVIGRPKAIFNRQDVWDRHKAGMSIRSIAAALDLSHGVVQRTVGELQAHLKGPVCPNL